MSLRVEPSFREKMAWIVILIAFAILEIQAISASDEANKKAREDQNTRFDQIAGGLRAQYSLSSDQFEKTMQEVESVFGKTKEAADTAKDAVNTITGGAGYCYFQLGTVDEFEKRTDKIVPSLTVKGTKILWHITSHVVDYKAFQADRSPINISDIMNRDAVTEYLGDIKSGSSPLFQPVGIVTDGKTDIDYLIDFWALNGTWHEEMHYRHTNGSLDYAIRVIWEQIPPNGDIHRSKNRVIFQDISIGYGNVSWIYPTEPS